MKEVVTEKNVFAEIYVEEGEQPRGKIDPEVNKKGEWLFTTHYIRSWNIETWVRRVACASGQRVDWSYAGGRAHVMALGDFRKVLLAIAGLLHEHDALWRVMSGPKDHEADIRTYPSRNKMTASDLHRPSGIEDARIVYGLAANEAFTVKELLEHHAAKVAIVGPHRFHPRERTFQEFATRHVQLLDEAKNILLPTVS